MSGPSSIDADAVLADASRSNSRLMHRHSLMVRLTHVVTIVCLYVLLLSGFQIFNAHPALYWGEASDFENPLLSMESRKSANDELIGITTILGREFETTGVFGVSSDREGILRRRAFPWWLTIPGTRWLAMARRWHFTFGWIFVLTGLTYVLHSVSCRHFTRDLFPSSADWRSLPRSTVDHALLRHPNSDTTSKYNILQKLTYLGVVFVLVPLLILTGLGMSPRMDVVLGNLVGAVGGRQSVRTLHFLLSGALVLFVFVHLFEVLVNGFFNNLRSITTGQYRMPAEKETEKTDVSQSP